MEESLRGLWWGETMGTAQGGFTVVRMAFLQRPWGIRMSHAKTSLERREPAQRSWGRSEHDLSGCRIEAGEKRIVGRGLMRTVR